MEACYDLWFLMKISFIGTKYFNEIVDKVFAYNKLFKLKTILKSKNHFVFIVLIFIMPPLSCFHHHQSHFIQQYSTLFYFILFHFILKPIQNRMKLCFKHFTH